MHRSCRHRALVVGALLPICAGALATSASEPVPRPAALPPAGTVLAEAARNIGFDYREVERSQVNSPGAFEGVGHFSFVYYKDEKLCQCSADEIWISPDGAFAVFTDARTGKLMLFNAKSRMRSVVSKKFVGYPDSATWTLSNRKAEIKLKYGSKQSVVISF